MLNHAVDISEKADMAELVHFVMTYGLYGELAADILQIVGRSRESRNTTSRKVILEVEANL